ncbi:hypothetical protein [Rhodoblastus sp.]|jgi:hypothetical protein|uniref:hypothetical protein n=1 Tax=Rhodoblastus sp. TaxID=1962975 RepID=UPI00263A0968|nr:hypothetical protein [Rhodoblastus sp.]
MSQTSNHPKTLRTPSELSKLSHGVGKVLRAFGEARGRDQMSSDEVLIFLALGHLGQAAGSQGVWSRPVTCLNLSEALNIPKETVRRKVNRLVELGLAASTTRGALIHDPEKWRLVAEAIASMAGCQTLRDRGGS